MTSGILLPSKTLTFVVLAKRRVPTKTSKSFLELKNRTKPCAWSEIKSNNQNCMANCHPNQNRTTNVGHRVMFPNDAGCTALGKVTNMVFVLLQKSPMDPSNYTGSLIP